MDRSAYHSQHCIGRFWDSGEDRSAKYKRRGVVEKDFKKLLFTWEEAEAAAFDRQEWCHDMAQCFHTDMG